MYVVFYNIHYTTILQVIEKQPILHEKQLILSEINFLQFQFFEWSYLIRLIANATTNIMTAIAISSINLSVPCVDILPVNFRSTFVLWLKNIIYFPLSIYVNNTYWAIWQLVDAVQWFYNSSLQIVVLPLVPLLKQLPYVFIIW